MIFVELVVYAFIALSIVYVLVSIYSRSVRREKLEKAWDADHADTTGDAAAPVDADPRDAAATGDPVATGDRRATGDTARSAYIEAGMRAYAHSLRARLIVLVYIIPLALFVALIYYNSFR